MAGRKSSGSAEQRSPEALSPAPGIDEEAGDAEQLAGDGARACEHRIIRCIDQAHVTEHLALILGHPRGNKAGWLEPADWFFGPASRVAVKTMDLYER